MTRILFVCVENSCRSQMAEGFARVLSRGGVEARSAGSRPAAEVDAKTIRLMREVGVDLSGQRSRGLESVDGLEFDAVVTMGCGDACPHVPARLRIDWAIPDPKGLPDGEFRAVRDRIRAHVRELLESLP